MSYRDSSVFVLNSLTKTEHATLQLNQGVKKVPFFTVLQEYCKIHKKSTRQLKCIGPDRLVIDPRVKCNTLIKSFGHEIHVDVVETVEWRDRERLLYKINKLAANLNIQRSGENCLSLSNDILILIFEYLDLPSLLECLCVCVNWHLIAVKQCLLIQLRNGDFAWYNKLNYPSWLAQVGEVSWNIAMSECEKQVLESKKWSALRLMKEPHNGWYGNEYEFVKAAGCIMVKSVVEISSPSNIKPLRKCSAHKYRFQQTGENDAKQPLLDEEPSLLPSAEKVEVQLYPTASNIDGFVCQAIDQIYLDISIEIFRSYFSPSLNYIFPLIVYQQQQFGLDFTSSECWIIFADMTNLPWMPRWWTDLHREKADLPLPIGSCAWRFRMPPLQLEGYGNKHPGGVLEVMFIGVWEKDRGRLYGSTLVAALESHALAAKAEFLYVEIGHTQPKAKSFWEKNGFRLCVLDTEVINAEEDTVFRVSAAQMKFFDAFCLRFDDTFPYIKPLL